jgi:membrane-bound lytic murein transglycosylase D
MWQFTRAAARIFMQVNSALDERLDPVASARGAARYLSHAYDLLGAWPLALTSYNHGIASMRAAKERFGTDFLRIVREYDHPKFGFASRNFYAEFLAAREIAKHPERYFPEGIRYRKPFGHDSIVLAEAMPLADVAYRYTLPPATLVALNPAWQHAAIEGRVPLPIGTEVWLPGGTLARFSQPPGALTATAVAGPAASF